MQIWRLRRQAGLLTGLQPPTACVLSAAQSQLSCCVAPLWLTSTLRSPLQCTVLEVKQIEGLGTTIDVVLVNGAFLVGPGALHSVVLHSVVSVGWLCCVVVLCCCDGRWCVRPCCVWGLGPGLAHPIAHPSPATRLPACLPAHSHIRECRYAPRGRHDSGVRPGRPHCHHHPSAAHATAHEGEYSSVLSVPAWRGGHMCAALAHLYLVRSECTVFWSQGAQHVHHKELAAPCEPTNNLPVFLCASSSRRRSA